MLTINFLNKKFTNPLVLASGILGVTGASLAKVIRDGAGGVTMKSVTTEPIIGNRNPVIVAEPLYLLNAVGLPGPGVGEAVNEVIQCKRLVRTSRIIGSIFGRTVKEFAKAAEQLADAPIDFLEVDISCPHATHVYKRPFAHDTRLITQITAAVKKVAHVPVIMKLSPNTWQIAEYAKAAEAAGADAITAVNTVSGMGINVEARKPVLANAVGGVSGPALKPIALKAVWDIYNAVDIPIIGTGGVTTGRDALEMIMAGATLVGVGSAFYYRGTTAMKGIAQEMSAIMKKEKIRSLKEIIGAAHA